MGNALRMLGKFSPTSGVINSVLGGAAGYAVGGPIGAIGLPAAGWAARRGAESATSRKARIAEEIMRMGGRATGTLPTANQEALARWWLLQLADEPIRQGSQ